MAQLPARRNGRDVTLADPFREFGDICDRMGKLVDVELNDREVLVTGEIVTGEITG
jgi:hypothetical protein